MPEALPEEAIKTRLEMLPAWTRDGDAITRTIEAPSFLTGIDIVQAAARAAEDADHHPDIDIRWRKVTFTLTTHDAGGSLTVLDFDLAAAIDAAATEHGV